MIIKASVCVSAAVCLIMASLLEMIRRLGAIMSSTLPFVSAVMNIEGGGGGVIWSTLRN